jgi:hypothetical protein
MKADPALSGAVVGSPLHAAMRASIASIANSRDIASLRASLNV